MATHRITLTTIGSGISSTLDLQRWNGTTWVTHITNIPRASFLAENGGYEFEDTTGAVQFKVVDDGVCNASKIFYCVEIPTTTAEATTTGAATTTDAPTTTSDGTTTVAPTTTSCGEVLISPNLLYSNISSAEACMSGSFVPYYGDTEDLSTTTVLYTGSCVFAPAGWYLNNDTGNWRYWDGDSFTISGSCGD